MLKPRTMTPVSCSGTSYSHSVFYRSRYAPPMLIYVHSWTKLKYPIPKEKRIRLAALYFELCATPGMPIQVIAACADSLVALTRSMKKLSINDLRLPWKPIYNILRQDLFLTRREFEYRYVPFSSFRFEDMTEFLYQSTVMVHGIHRGRIQEILPPCCYCRDVGHICAPNKWYKSGRELTLLIN